MEAVKLLIMTFMFLFSEKFVFKNASSFSQLNTLRNLISESINFYIIVKTDIKIIFGKGR